ncbi:nucleotidyltransferase family protein [Phormidium sp. CCY1219]|uniref:nucleotidyltransferase family protein n=1 Tax=Phormidium sp. CCY1219 TaxID=2886104 RepID=UPI002D1F1B73|nr:nucleotidyltransferase family protein [Phormidium sp. CCY1219]MEB3829142.1 nucleotidyltransferase family protein [Phormidium sp. CCY1219]
MNQQNPMIWGQPTFEQKRLLQAAVETSEKAIAYWEEWSASVNIETLDSESYRLLPLLYRNLSQYHIGDRPLAKLKGVYRRTWCENQVIFKKLTEILQEFEAASIPSLLIKDAALCLLYYSDIGERTIHNFEILVCGEDAITAMKILSRMGWKPKKPIPDRLSPSDCVWEFTTQSNLSLMLRWHLFWDAFGEPLEETFWQGARKTAVGDTFTHVLHPTDRLFYISVAGGSRTPVVPLVRLADACRILQVDGDEIDGDELRDRVKTFRFILPWQNFIKAFEDTFHVPFVNPTVSTSQTLSASQFERQEWRCLHSTSHSPIKRVLNKYFTYQRRFGAPEYRVNWVKFFRTLKT